MNKTVVKVPKLTETNYDTWTEMMSYLFDSNGGHKYINELIPIADIEEQAEREIFTNTAMLIVAHVHSDLQNLIRSDRSDPNSRNPYTLWRKLENHFNPQTFSHRHTLKTLFYALVMDDFESIEAFVLRIKSTAEKLNSLTEKQAGRERRISKYERYERKVKREIFSELGTHTAHRPDSPRPSPSSSSSSSSSSAPPSSSTPRESKFKSRQEQDPTEIRNSLFYYFKNHFDIFKTFLKELGFELAGYVSDDDKLSVLLVGVKANYEIMYNHLVGREHLTFQSASEYLIQHATDSRSDTINRMEEKKRHNPDKSPKEDSSRRDVDKPKKPCQKCGKKHPPRVRCKRKPKKDSDDIFLCAFGDKKETVSSSSHRATCQLILDSGCSRHIVGKKLFSNLFDIHEVSPRVISLVDAKTYTSNRAGTLIVQPVKGGKTLHITDVTYVPEINDCFISISQLAKKNLISIFKGDICQIRSKNDVLITAKHTGGLYRVETFKVVADSLLCSDSKPSPTEKNNETIMDIHSKLGHVSGPALLKAIVDRHIHGVDLTKVDQVLKKCSVCCEAKSKARKKLGTKPSRAQYPLDATQADSSGLLPPTMKGNRGFQVAIDVYSRRKHVDLFKVKTENPHHIKGYIEAGELETGNLARTLRTDCAGEYESAWFTKYLKDKGIHQEFSAPHCQSQNGLAERAIGTLSDMANCMLVESGLQRKYWGYAVKYAAKVSNVTPTSALNGLTPYEMYYGRPPKITMYHTFGCLCFRQVPKDQHKKFTPKSERCLFLGLSDNHEAFIVLRLDDSRVMISRDVNFIDNSFPLTSKSTSVSDDDDDDDEDDDHEGEVDVPIFGSKEYEKEEEDDEDDDLTVNLTPGKITRSVYLPPRESHNLSKFEADVEVIRKKKRVSMPNPRYAKNTKDSANPIFDISDPNLDFLLAASVVDDAPKSYAAAMKSKDAKKWRQAACEEIEALLRNGTWEVVPIQDVPAGTRIHNPVWRFKQKLDGRYKGRMCFNGSDQLRGVDVEESSSQVPTMETVRTIITAMVQKAARIVQADVFNAFLHAEVDVDVYMRHPPGFPGPPGTVCKIKKGLYGMRQASLLWQEKAHKTFVSMGFVRSKKCKCLYFYKYNGHWCAILIYVDDLLMASSYPPWIDKILATLDKRFGIRYVEGLGLYLGIKCDHDSIKKTIHMSQPHIVEKLTSLLQTQDLKPTKSPANPKITLVKDAGDPIDISNYRSAIGLLLWLARCTRPDIMFQVIMLSQFQVDPRTEHWGAVKHLVRYLMGTLHLGITINKANSSKFVAIFDASHADVQLQRKSASGCFVFLSGTPVVFTTNKQKCTALTSAEAEYVSMSDGMKKVAWIAGLLAELNQNLGFDYPIIPEVWTDSQPVIALLEKNDPENTRLRHIDIRCHWILEYIKKSQAVVKWIPSEFNLADLLTKSSRNLALFNRLRDHIM